MFAVRVFLCLWTLGRADTTVGTVGGNVRILDATGSPSHVGILQVRTDDGFGSVCGLTMVAADVVCKQLGFVHGTVSTSPCSNYGGTDLCGPSGFPVAMKDLDCAGNELDVGGCVWSRPDDVCKSHALDSIVHCANAVGMIPVEEGSARLMSYDGAPSYDGQGVLEMFHDGGWTPVCNSGFAASAEVVACKQLGFDGASALSDRPKCRSFMGHDFCGVSPPRVSELICKGIESEIRACSFKHGDDVFCAPEESVVLRCVGEVAQ